MLQHRGRRAEVIDPAQQSLDLGHEHALIEGLGDKVVSAQVHGHDDVHIVRRRRDKNHRNPGYPPDLRTPVVPIEAGQADVQQYQMGIEFRKFLHDVPQIPDLPHL